MRREHLFRYSFPLFNWALINTALTWHTSKPFKMTTFLAWTSKKTSKANLFSIFKTADQTNKYFWALSKRWKPFCLTRTTANRISKLLPKEGFTRITSSNNSLRFLWRIGTSLFRFTTLKKESTLHLSRQFKVATLVSLQNTFIDGTSSRLALSKN